MKEHKKNVSFESRMNMKLEQTNKNRNRFILLAFISLLIIIFSAEAAIDMFGIFKKYDVHLSPEVQGKLTLNGKPVVNATVRRTLTYVDDKSDQTKTDNNGVFYFPEKNIKSRRPGQILDETRVFQMIEATYQGSEYVLWYTVTEGEKHKNINAKLQELICELTNSEEKNYFKNDEHPSFTHNVISICRWDKN